MHPLWLIVPATGFVAAALAGARRLSRRQEWARLLGEWEALARRTPGFECVPGEPGLQGDLDGHPAFVDTRTGLSYGYDAMLGLTVECPNNRLGEVNVFPETLDEAVHQISSRKRLVFDDSAFGEAFRVWATDPRQAREALSETVRAALLALPGGAVLAYPDTVTVLFDRLDPQDILAATEVFRGLLQGQPEEA